MRMRLKIAYIHLLFDISLSVGALKKLIGALVFSTSASFSATRRSSSSYFSRSAFVILFACFLAASSNPDLRSIGALPASIDIMFCVSRSLFGVSRLLVTCCEKFLYSCFVSLAWADSELVWFYDDCFCYFDCFELFGYLLAFAENALAVVAWKRICRETSDYIMAIKF